MLTFFIDTESEIIIEKYTRVSRISNIANLMVNIWEHPDYDQNYDRVVDFQEVDLVFSREEFQNFIKIIKENDQSMRGRAAVMVQTPTAAAITTLYEDEMNHMHTVGIFASESEVMNFLNIDDSIFSKIDGSEAVTIHLEQ